MSQVLASRPAGRRQECTIGQLHPKSSTVQQQQQQSVIQPDTHRQQLDDNKTQQQQLIAGGQKSVLSRQQSVDKIQSAGDGHSSYQTDKADCWNSERMSKTARTIHRLSRRHSSATILPQTGETTQFQVQQQQQLVTGSRLRERSSSTRASSSGRCRLVAGQYEQQQQHEDKVHRLNVPGQAGQYNRTKNSRSAEQLERLQLLLLAPAQPQSHRHRQSSGDKMVGQPVQQTSGRLTVSPVPPPVPPQAPRQQELRHQTGSKQHVRSQSVRAPSASSAGRSGKLAGITNSNNSPSHGGSIRVSGNNDKKTSGQNKARPRGASLPSNRASAAAATALAAAAASSVSATTTLADTSGAADEGDDYYLLRHFIVHGKGKKVVNRGDSFRRLRHQQQQQQQQQQQRQGSISQHSSTSSISSTENVAGSPPPGQQHPPGQHQQQQQAQYYSYSDHQSSSSSRRASLLGAAGAAGPSDGQQITYGIHSSSAPPVAAPDPYRVLMLGSSGVGKTALTAQFMTSEYLNTYEASLDEDSFDRSVSVLLDGEESQLIFIDHPRGEISVENCMSTYNPHAFVIVYSVVDAESLRQAEEVLHFLWRHSLTNVSTPLLAANNQRQIQQQPPTITPPTTTLSPASNTSIAQFQQQPSPVKATPSPPQLLLPPPPPVVILVANKIDLVRSRIISPQAGKSLATSFDCKYIETSSGMQHNVDELLVGILKQIRLKIQMAQQQLINWSVSSSSSSTSKSLFRKRSGRRRQQQRVNYNGGDRLASAENGSGLTEGSCCIVTNPSSTSPRSSVGGNNGGYLLSTTSNNRRSTSLRVRRMLGKAVWTCADYYHRNKSRSCEDLHVL